MRRLTEFDVHSPEYYGFGIGIMKRIKVCEQCGASEEADRQVCRKCGAGLPEGTLYQRYQLMHRKCRVCNTVLNDRMRFCPHCGIRVESKREGE